MTSRNNIISFDEARRDVRFSRAVSKSSRRSATSRAKSSTSSRESNSFRTEVRKGATKRVSDRKQGYVSKRTSASHTRFDDSRTSAFQYANEQSMLYDGYAQTIAPRESRRYSGKLELAQGGSYGSRQASRELFYEGVHDEYDPRFDIFSKDIDQAMPDDQEDFQPRSKAEVNKRKKAKSRAAKKFMKQFGDEAPASTEGGTRAALYEFQMGHEHKRACSQMNEGTSQSGSSRVKVPREHSTKSHGSVLRYILGGVAVFALVGAFLYPAAQQYYIEMRNHDRIQAEYDAVVARNEAIETDVEHLQTDEGVQDAARAELGWVNKGENAVVVNGLPDEVENTSGTKLHPQIPSGSIKAPDTWYSDVLDAFFGYSSLAQV